MKRFLLSASILFCVVFLQAQAQTCAGGSGDQLTYGTNSWIGYVYDATGSGTRDFGTYRGYVTETTDNFDRNWGSGTTNKPTCSNNAGANFTIRYLMVKNYPAGSYTISHGKDDGTRVYVGTSAVTSVAGFSSLTFSSARWTTTGLTMYNFDWAGGPMYLVFEYNQVTGGAEAYFNICYNGPLQAYGTGSWNGYYYNNTTPAVANYTGQLASSFYTTNTPLYLRVRSTSAVPALVAAPTGTTSCFTASASNFVSRHLQTLNLTPSFYLFTDTSDDGIRVSTQGPSTWNINSTPTSWDIVNNFGGGGNFATTAYLGSGTYNMVIEHEEGGVPYALSNNICQMNGNYTYGTYPVWNAFSFNSSTIDFTKYAAWYKSTSSGTTLVDNNFVNAVPSNSITNISGYTAGGCTGAPTLSAGGFTSRYWTRRNYTSPGVWVFTTPSNDDGRRLYVDYGSTGVQTLIFDALSSGSGNTTSQPVFLNAGNNDLYFDYRAGSTPNRANLVECQMTGGDLTAYGTGSWKVYDYASTTYTSFLPANYRGTFTTGTVNSTTASFSLTNTNVATASNATGGQCGYTGSGQSIRALLTNTFALGAYNVTIGNDDYFELSFDGGSTFPVAGHNANVSSVVYLDGTSKNLVYQADNSGGGGAVYNVSVTIANATAGILSAAQPCGSTGATLTLTGNVGFVQFQSSPDGVNWSNIGSQYAQSNPTYNVSTGTTNYYRALVTSNGTTATTNVVNLPGTVGDQVTYGLNGQWIGYEYYNTGNTATGVTNSFLPSSYIGWLTDGIDGNPTITQNWGGANPPTLVPCISGGINYSIRYKTQIYQPEGWYYFSISSDDGSRLSISQTPLTSGSYIASAGSATGGPYAPYLANSNGNAFTQGSAANTVYWTGGIMYLTLEYDQITGLGSINFNMCKIGTGTDGYPAYPSWNANAYYNGTNSTLTIPPTDPVSSFVRGAGSYSGSFSSQPVSPTPPYTAGNTNVLLYSNWGSTGPALTSSSGCNPYPLTTDNYNYYSIRYKSNRTYTSTGLYFYSTPANDDGAALFLNGTSVFNSYNQGSVGTGVPFGGNVIQTAGTNVNMQFLYQQETGGAIASLTECQYNLLGNDITLNTYGSGLWNVYAYNNNGSGTYTYNVADYAGYFTSGSATSTSATLNLTDVTVASGITNTCGRTSPASSVNQYIKALASNTFSPGVYTVFIGTDDHYALSLDGGSTFPYLGVGGTGITNTTYINGATNLVFKGDNSGGSGAIYKVTITGVAPAVGILSSNQTCNGSANVTLALSTFTGYIQWQTSTDGSTWINSGALNTNGTLAVNPAATTFYRAIINSNGTTVTSNSIAVTSGTITGNFTVGTNISLGGTINISGDFTVPSGVTVTVPQGCALQVNANNIIVNGTINADGAGYTGAIGGIPGYNTNCNTGCANTNCNNIAQPGGSGGGGGTGNGTGGGNRGNSGQTGSKVARTANAHTILGIGYCDSNTDGQNDGGPGGGGGGGGTYGGTGGTAINIKGGNGWNRSGLSPAPLGGSGGTAGSVYGSSDLSTETISMGSGGGGAGGGGGGSYCGSSGGNGGNGGGTVWLNASQNLTVSSSGVITANGTSGGVGGAGSGQQGGYNKFTINAGAGTCATTYDGTGGGGGGAGGGSGGGILLEALGVANVAGIIRANGGPGGTGGVQGDANSAGGMGGAGGGGGRIKIAVNTCQNNNISAALTTTGGTAGSGANGNSNGNAGNAGTINTTITNPAYVPFTAGGTISSSQTICTSGTPAPFTGTTPTGGTNAYYYEWFSCNGGSCGNPVVGNPAPGTGWTDRGGSATITGFTETNNLTQTTSYVRGVVSTYAGGTGTWGTNTLGSCIQWSNVVTVTVQPQPTLSALTNVNMCAGGSTDFAVTAAGGVSSPTSFQWQYYTGSAWNNISNGAPANISYAVSGTALASNLHITTGTAAASGPVAYRCVAAFNGTGCTPSVTSNTGTLTIFAQPLASAIVPNIPAGNACNGQTLSATFSAGSGGTGTITDVYEFSTDGGNTYNNYVASTGINTAGLVGQTVIIRSSRTATGGSCNTSAYNTISWLVNPLPSVTAGNAGPYVVGQTISLSASSATANTYQWSGPVSYTATGQNVTRAGVTTAMAGSYTVTATNTGGCTATASTNVVIATSSSYTWTGATSTDWAEPTNWSPTAPVAGPNACATDVVIPSVTNSPVISSAVSVGNIQLNANALLTLNGANINVCKNWTGGTGTRAIVAGSGMVIINGSAAQTISGKTSIFELMVDNNTGVSLQTGAAVDVYNAVDLKSGTLNTTSGTLTFKSNNVDSVAILDNFTAGYTGTITGNVVAERYYASSLTYNQHFMGSPVNAPALTQIGAAGTPGFVTPKSTCDETKLASTSAYGTVFTLHENNGATCSQAEWKVETTGTMQNGLGYSVLKSGAGKLTVTGAANLSTTYTLNNLANSNWSNTSLQGRTNQSGWQLVSNPYLATLDVTTTNAGFDNQVQVWNANGPFAGSYQQSNIIAPFQAFMVHKTSAGAGGTYTISATDRRRAAQTFYSLSSNELNIVAQNTTTGLMDQTKVGFNENATDGFDAGLDADKFGGDLSRHTLYSVNNGKWMAKNILNSIATTSTVPVGFEPGSTATYTFSFDGVNTFDPTSYIYLEDKALNVMHDVRSGSYTFTADSADNWDRFVLHFTPPAVIATADASCSAAGSINIQQPGTANWSYTLTDSSHAIVTSGTLNQSQPVTVQVAAGAYILTLTDTNNYVAVKSIQVNGAEPVIASFNVSRDSVITQQSVSLTATTTSAASYQWNFGNGSYATGANATVSYAQPGVYTVNLVVTGTGGCSSTQTQTITVSAATATGLSNVTNADNLKIWSNENKVYVDFTGLSKVEATVTIYNLLGQTISSERVGSVELYQKNISNIEAAYFIVMVKNDETITTKKVFIINK